MTHPALVPGSVAVVTGGAAGIGYAAALRFADLGLKVCIADLGAERLARAQAAIAVVARDGPDAVMAVEADVSRGEDIQRLEAAVRERFGGTDVLMNNAGIQPGSTVLGPDNWAAVIAVDLWGVIHGTQAFVPGMIARGRPGLIINTGSKLGITLPLEDPAYGVAKAGVKVFTETLAHDLRNTPGCQLTAHLFLPGWVFTALTARGSTQKPSGAWTADQSVDFMLRHLAAGDFYILSPDNDVSRRADERRVTWAAGDIVENRPALSRWHPDYAAAFKAFEDDR